MTKYENLIFVDVEARGRSPLSGDMTEFGAVHYTTKKTYHGVLADAIPDPDNPAVPLIVGDVYPVLPIMAGFASWLKLVVKGRPTFVSDNPAYDFQWINAYFDHAEMDNPFGHSGRRISDFWAGLNGDWSNTQKWKQYRVTPHDHNPVNDAMGNVEAFEKIVGK